MKKTTELKDAVVKVALTAGNGEKYDFQYRIDSLDFIDLIELFSRIEKDLKKDKGEEQKGKDFLKIFRAIKRVIGAENYEEIKDFAEENGEEFGIEDLIQIIGGISELENENEVPKGSK